MVSSRLQRAWSRSRHAAVGASIGAAVGGLFSRNAASSGAAIGALVGAVVGEKRVSTRSRVEDVVESRSVEE